MKKVENKKGFSLAELLIVIAIMAVLVAIAIPAFGDQIERSRESVDLSGLRNGYTEAAAVMMTTSRDKVFFLYQMPIKQQRNDWQSDTNEFPIDISDLEINSAYNLAKEQGNFTAGTNTDTKRVATFVFTFDRDEQKVSGVYVLGDPDATDPYATFDTNADVAGDDVLDVGDDDLLGVSMDGKTVMKINNSGKIAANG